MTNEVNNKLKSNPLYIKYLREHSYYYKLLNRDPNLFSSHYTNLNVIHFLLPL